MKTIRYTTTTSTNDAARHLAAMNPGEPLLVSADQQTAGRGRVGRKWSSPIGGAWFSLAVPVHQPTPTAPLTVGMAVRRVVSVLTGADDEVTIKWPNDVLLRGRKVAGILCEQVLPDMKRRDLSRPDVTLILGIGLNVNNPVQDDESLRHPATSLAETLGHPMNVDRLVDHIAQTILDYLRRPFVAADVLAHLAWRDEPVCVTLDEREHRGMLTGLDSTGRLRLRTDNQTLTLDAGDVRRVRLETKPCLGRTEPSDPVPV